MSRIGKQPIKIPSGVEVKVEGSLVKVKGPKGQLERVIHGNIKVEVKDGAVYLSIEGNPSVYNKYYGLSRTLVSNMVEGVSKGFTKSLTLVGVGYRAQMVGKDLELALGYSHPILYTPPKGIEIKAEKRTEISVLGYDKELVGQVAANIRSFRAPEPYHGKGVRYSNEVVLTKVGKAGAK